MSVAPRCAATRASRAARSKLASLSAVAHSWTAAARNRSFMAVRACRRDPGGSRRSFLAGAENGVVAEGAFRAGDRSMATEAKSRARLIKRYGNRKLYDVEASRYVT